MIKPLAFYYLRFYSYLMNIKIGRSMGGSKMKQIQAVQLTKGLVQIESTDPGTYEREIKD